ncbi:MAG: CDP-alcohol phosphatidyltransferase family protein [Nanoarchaeota archaeon]|nr:CDP-alcohol phosphatidyltransferase family protein [Nanoarchaeota archaeon]MBU1004803.1 CDP-alcohol phosphatidyltransferase family protein [Nanoarchaeota archaeon]MBU1946479.1 CDP-alcohol phosphatidyltransferase family protein [Nanoarchaeota archaeon]
MNIPNKITLARILLAPLFVIVFFIDSLSAKIIALIIAILIELTDLFDGIIARSSRKITKFGKLVDPLADSISRLTIFVCFAAYNTQSGLFISPVWSINNIHLIPVWMAVLLVFRDTIVSTLRTLAASHKIILHARTSGKIKAVVQAIGIISILLLVVLSELYPVIPLNVISYFIMLAVTIVTVWSGFDYIAGNKELFKEMDF